MGLGLISVDAGKAGAGPVLDRWPALDDETVLAGWLAGLRSACAAESDRRFPDSVAVLVTAALRVLDSVSAEGDLERLVHATVYGNPNLFERYYSITADRYIDAGTGRLRGLLDLLAAFGMVTGGPGEERTTELGRWAAVHLMGEEPATIEADAPADEVLARLAGIAQGQARWAAARPWLLARPLEVAADQLLAAAAGTCAAWRLAAVDVVDCIGEAALPAWRRAATLPDLGPHVRAVLAGWDDADVPVGERLWLAIEYAAGALTSAGPDEALSCVYDTVPGADLDSRLLAVHASGHPEATALAEALTAFVASGAPRTIDQVLQLKVTLTRWRPPIWRRVLMPASASLGDLHRAIQVLFGWDGEHLHAFTVGRNRYSDPFYGLKGPDDEYSVRLHSALAGGSGTIGYDYDFGAGWRHEITLEKTLARDPARTYPICTAFKSDSPVEYWSEDDPSDPEPFDLTEVNRRLHAPEEDDW
ncbi:plasmid pRiA4b ORF-3 family protein [Dactylosporangium sp. CA-092794]|uniref:plasmid pRiA4b ORF-3 family protein n=1 Tax=Dactylosporangium sp. CA-092794 TaxID=3239929 RepID=UPI003D8FEB2C